MSTERQAALWTAATELVSRGIKVAMVKIVWDVEHETKTLPRDFTPRPRWQHLPIMTPDEIAASITKGCNAYLYRLPDDVRVIDADTPNAVMVARREFGTEPAVVTRKGGHWLFRATVNPNLEGTVFDNHHPTQLYGPGSWYETPAGVAEYVGTVPDFATLPDMPAMLQSTARMPEQRLVGGSAVTPTGFFAPAPTTAEQAKAAIQEKLAEVAAGSAQQGTGGRKRIMGAAFTMGGYLHAGWFTHEEAIAELHAAITACYGSVNKEDDLWIAQGLRDGDKPEKRFRVLQEKQQADGDTAALSADEDDPDALTFDDYDGEYVPPTPGLLDLGWSTPLLYQGTPEDPRSNMLFGAPGCGKTWLAAIAAVQRAAAGERVWYVDYENSKPSLVARLKAVGLTREAARLITYTRAAQEPAHDVHRRLAGAASGRYGLVVIDGMNSALNSLDLDENKTGDVTRWYQQFISVIPTVLILDHTAKSPDGYARKTAIGSQAKEAALSGVAWSLEKIKAFGTAGGVGLLKLSLGKDRPGGLEGRVRDGELLADVRVQPGGGRVAIEVRTMMGDAVSPEEAVFEAMRIDGVEMAVSRRDFLDGYKVRNGGKGMRNEAAAAAIKRYQDYVVSMEETPSLVTLSAVVGGPQLHPS